MWSITEYIFHAQNDLLMFGLNRKKEIERITRYSLSSDKRESIKMLLSVKRLENLFVKEFQEKQFIVMTDYASISIQQLIQKYKNK